MSLSFLSPLTLLALPVLLIPVLLHLFFRKKQNVIYFSYIELIRKAAERTRIKSKLRRYLLLAARTLILMLLVMLFARPVWQFGRTERDAGQNTAVILLIDTSYSMGYIENGKTRFESSVEKAKKILTILPSKARAGIISFSDKVEYASPSLTNNFVSLSSELDKLKLTYKTTNMAPAWNAAQLLAGQLPNAQTTVILLSDNAAHGYKEKLTGAGQRTRIIGFEAGKSENIWFSGVKTEYDELLSQWKLESSVSYSLLSGKTSLPITYFSGTRKAGSDLVEMKGLEGKTISAFAYSNEDNSIALKARLLEDPLDCDNIYYVTGRRRDPFKIWILDGDQKSGGITSESFFLKNAFPSAEVFGENSSEAPAFSVPGVVIAANLRALPLSLERFVNSGGGALIFLGDRTPDDFQAELLPAVLGMQFDKRLNISWCAPETHFLAKAVDTTAFEWDKIFADKGYALQPKDGTQVIARFDNGWPFLVEAPFWPGKVMLCASTADREWDNLPGRPVFAPLMQNIARYLSGISGQKDQSNIVVGDPLRYRAVQSPEIITPSGKTEKARLAGDELVFENTLDPGFYRLLSSGREIFRFSVNLNTSSGESELKTLSAGDLKSYFNAPVALLSSEWEKELVIMLTGIDASRYFILAILLLILIELMLSTPKIK